MADNFVANPGIGGDIFAADDIAGVKYPRSKLGFGDDGSYADVSESSRLPVKSSIPYASTPPTIMYAQTSAGGTAFVSFGSQACDSLELLVTDATTNAIGVAIEYKINGTGTALPLFYGDSDLITGLTNANQISVRRVDQSTTQIYVYAKAHTL